MQRAGVDGVLLAGVQLDVAEGGKALLVALGGQGRGALAGLVVDEQVAHAPAAAEGLLLAGLAVDLGVQVLGAGLVGQQRHLLGAHARGVDVDEQLKADGRQVGQAEVCHLDAFGLLGGDGDVRLLIERKRGADGFVVLGAGDHGRALLFFICLFRETGVHSARTHCRRTLARGSARHTLCCTACASSSLTASSST